MTVEAPRRQLLDGLNEAQAAAVDASDGPLLIFAGAGSGKTKVLTHRIANVITTRGINAAEICAVTFTNKAAREMQSRIETLLGTKLSGMWIGTFHSLAARILRRDGTAIGIDHSFVIYDEADRVAATKRAIRNLGIDEKRFPASKVVHTISAAKSELIDSRQFAASAHNFYEEHIAQIYAEYQAEMRQAQALDFDDLLMCAVQLFQDAPEVLERYQMRFRHLFVDEYQDTNHPQYLMVKLLSSQHRNLTVVGDDDQSIYQFRGANVRNILDFKRDFPDAAVVTLEQNYRSTQNILDAAYEVIRVNRERSEKRLWTERGTGNPVTLLQVYDEQEEALTICQELDRLIGHGDYSLNDCAVLYRTNAQSRAFEDVFLRRGIPYRLVGGVRFYERREIKDVLAYLRLIANPNDLVSFARVVNVPRRKIGDKTVAEIEREARRSHRTLPAVLADASRLEIGLAAKQAVLDFLELIEGLRATAERLPLPQLLEHLLQVSGYAAMVQDGSPEGEERMANVTELVGLAAEYVDVPPPENLQQFLENVALVSDVDSLDESAQGVTLITLHQVKGLEFPVVFLAGMEEGLLPHVRSLEEGEDGVSEERRLAYVGMTRAKDRLYLSHAYRRHLYGAPQLAQASRFLADVPTQIMQLGSGSSPLPQVRSRGDVQRAVHEYAAKPNPTEPLPAQFVGGMRVGHPKYGQGTVLKSTMTRAGEEVVIKFDGHGVKIFSVADSKLYAI